MTEEQNTPRKISGEELANSIRQENKEFLEALAKVTPVRAELSKGLIERVKEIRNEPEIGKYVYRFEDLQLPDDRCSPACTIQLSMYRILKETKHTYLISTGIFTKRVMYKNARRVFACRSIDDALASYIARKKKHIYFAETRCREAKERLRLAEELQLPYELLLRKVKEW